MPSDTTTRWLPVRQAAGLIGATIANPLAAENEIINAALSGLIRLSCEALNVQTLAGDMLFTVRRPGDDANLANRINKARKSDRSGFIFKPESSFATWLDLSNRARINVHRLLVDANGVAAFFPDPISAVPQIEPCPESQPSASSSVSADLPADASTNAKDKADATPAPIIDAGRSDRTGGAGRPSSIHLIAPLMRERARRGELCLTLTAEADALHHIFKSDPANEGLAKPSPKVIKNKLIELYHELKRLTPKID